MSIILKDKDSYDISLQNFIDFEYRTYVQQDDSKLDEESKKLKYAWKLILKRLELAEYIEFTPDPKFAVIEVHKGILNSVQLIQTEFSDPKECVDYLQSYYQVIKHPDKFTYYISFIDYSKDKLGKTGLFKNEETKKKYYERRKISTPKKFINVIKQLLESDSKTALYMTDIVCNKVTDTLNNKV